MQNGTGGRWIKRKKGQINLNPKPPSPVFIVIDKKNPLQSNLHGRKQLLIP